LTAPTRNAILYDRYWDDTVYMKNAFSKEFIERMKETLQKRLAVLEEEMQRMENESKAHLSSENAMQAGDSDDDNAQEIAELSNIVAIQETLDKEVTDTKKALKKIAEGTYGFCSYCKQPIDERRLEARPASSSCVACKKALKQEV